MKKLGILFFVIVGLSVANAQYKDSGFHESDIKNAMIDNSPFGNGQGLALGVLTNSMFYKFSDKLNGQLDISLVHSPYSTLGKDFQNSINGIYVSRAAINYQPWKNTLISVQYRNVPNTYYNPFNPYHTYGYGYDAFDNTGSIFIR